MMQLLSTGTVEDAQARLPRAPCDSALLDIYLSMVLSVEIAVPIVHRAVLLFNDEQCDRICTAQTCCHVLRYADVFHFRS